MRKAISESLEGKIDKLQKGQHWTKGIVPPEERKLPVYARLTLPTYHRIASTMERLGCGLSEALEAMLQNVEAQKVAPIDKKWRDRYRVRRGGLYQSFDFARRVPKIRTLFPPKK
jgi:aromatic ring hydroxylase